MQINTTLGLFVIAWIVYAAAVLLMVMLAGPG